VLSINTAEVLSKKRWSKRYYQFFDYSLEVRSDSGLLLEDLDLFFGQFSAQEEADVNICYLVSDSSIFGMPVLFFEGKRFSVFNVQHLIDYAILLILNSLPCKVTTHYLFHAASLHYRGKGFVIAGDSGRGKSTLSLELLRRGFNFISDDIAALGANDHRIYPFPFPLRLDEGGMQLFAETAFHDFEYVPCSSDQRKGMGFIGQKGVYPACSSICAFDYLICLSSWNGREKDLQREEKGSTYAAVDHIDEGMIEELRKDLTIQDISISPRGHFYQIKVAWKNGIARFRQLEELCSRHEIFLFTMSDENQEAFNYQLSPTIENMSPSGAALELYKSFRGGTSAWLYRKKFEASPGRFLMSVGKLVKGVKSYYLSPGKLNEMGDTICALI
jgi:hypothetical protein